MYFAAHGKGGSQLTQHFETVVPEHAALLLEGIPTDHTGDEAYLKLPLFRDVHAIAQARGSVILPGGFNGEPSPENDTSFHPDEPVRILNNVTEISYDQAERFMRIQMIREMRSAVGSLAWLGVQLVSDSDLYTERPVALWGRHHASSLPDMYDRLGVKPIDVTVLDGHDHAVIEPHARTWNDAQIQQAYEVAHRHATNYFNAKSSPSLRRL